MIKKLTIVLFCYLGLLAVYDSAIKIYKRIYDVDYSINLSVFYYVSEKLIWMCLFYVVYSGMKNKYDKWIIGIASMPVLIRIFLYLSCINQSWDVYVFRTSNIFIDLVTWVFLTAALTIVLWRKYIRSSE